MFFDKQKKKGKKLAKWIIHLQNEQFSKNINDVKSKLNLSNVETTRLVFCLYILNLCSIGYFVTLYETNRNNVQKIMDSTFDHLKKQTPITSWRDGPRIGEFFVLSEEKLSLRRILGDDMQDNVRTDFHTLLTFAYNIRLPQYAQAINKLMAKALNKSEVATKPEDEILIDPVAELVVKHFSGKDLKDFGLADGLLIDAYFVGPVIAGHMEIVHKVVTGKV